MKIKQLICLIGAIITTINLNAADSDLRKGIDFTGLTSATAAQHNQLVDNGTIATNKGLILPTNGTPNIAGRPAYTNWVWLDKSVDPPVLKVYYSGIGSWVSATLPDGAVTTSKIADGAVIHTKIATDGVWTTNLLDQSVTSAKIAPLNVVELNIGNSNVTRVKMAYGAVDSTILTNGAVATANLQDGSVTGAKLAAGTIVATNLAVNSVSNINIVTGGVLGTNIGVLAIGNTNYGTASISTNKLAFYIPEFYNGTTNSIPLAGGSQTYTHGLSGMPTRVQLSLLCVLADTTIGAVGGDEILATGVNDSTGGPAFTMYYTSNSIVIVRSSTTGTLQAIKRSDGANTDFTAQTNKYVMKVRAWFQP